MSCVVKYLFTPGSILRCSSAIAADQIQKVKVDLCKNLSSILKLNHHSRDEVGAVVAKIAAFIAAFLGCYHKDNQGSKALFQRAMISDDPYLILYNNQKSNIDVIFQRSHLFQGPSFFLVRMFLLMKVSRLINLLFSNEHDNIKCSESLFFLTLGFSF